MSMKKKARTMQVPQREAMEVPVLGSLAGMVGSLVSINGALLYVPEAIRTVGAGQSGQPKRVVAVVMADASALVSVTLWNKSAEAFKMLAEAYDACDESCVPRVRMANLEVISLPGPSEDLVKLQSTVSTRIAVERESMEVNFVARPLGVTVGFSGLQNALDGMYVHLQGMIGEPGELSHSSSDVPVRRFKLVDGEGYWVQATAFGPSACDPVFRAGANIIGFYGKVQKSNRNGEHGSVWYYHDSYVHELPMTDAKPALLEEVIVGVARDLQQ